MTEASREFRDRWGLGSFVVVADRGTITAAILRAPIHEGREYVIAERLRRSTANEALARAGRRKHVTRDLEVQEIMTDGIERVLVCRVAERTPEDARQRHATAQPLQGNIAQGGDRDQFKRGVREDLRRRGYHPRDRP